MCRSNQRKKSLSRPRPKFWPGVVLAQEEHEQDQKNLGLLVAQPKLERQFKHGVNLVCAGVHAN